MHINKGAVILNLALKDLRALKLFIILAILIFILYSLSFSQWDLPSTTSL